MRFERVLEGLWALAKQKKSTHRLLARCGGGELRRLLGLARAAQLPSEPGRTRCVGPSLRLCGVCSHLSLGLQ